MIAIVDYGVGNLRSVQKAFERLGHEAIIAADASELADARGLVLPGVGAFGDAMENLRRLGLIEAIDAHVEAQRPLLGICLGLQLLFSVSEEHGEHVGLGLIPGRVRRMQGEYKIPHVGWNQISIVRPHALVDGISDGAFSYFVHSYYVEPQQADVVVATTDYHQVFPIVVAQGHILGVQFHPEKSSHAGLCMLNNFAALCKTEVHQS